MDEQEKNLHGKKRHELKKKKEKTMQKRKRKRKMNNNNNNSNTSKKEKSFEGAATPPPSPRTVQVCALIKKFWHNVADVARKVDEVQGDAAAESLSSSVRTHTAICTSVKCAAHVILFTLETFCSTSKRPKSSRRPCFENAFVSPSTMATLNITIQVNVYAAVREYIGTPRRMTP